MKMTRTTLKKLGLPMPSKYGNKRTRCLSRHIHDSKVEAEYCNGLLADKDAGRILEYFIQYPFVLAPGIVHVVDFYVVHSMKILPEVHEVKGHQTKEWKIKYKLFVDKYPNIKYVIINRKDQSWTSKEKGRPAFPARLLK